MSAPAAGSSGELERRLSSFDLATMVVAITIGAGIYSAPQLVARLVPGLGMALACWTVGGLFALLGVLVYAEVGSRIPDTGGEYVYLRRVFGPWAGFLVSWLDFFLVAPNARVGLALLTAAYLAPGGGPAVRVAIAAAVLVGLCAVIYLGVGPSMFAQRALVALKVGGLLVLIAAVARLPDAPLDAAALAGAAGATTDPTARDLAAAMVLVVFTYLGWQYIVAAVGEVRRPSRSLPIGLLAGMGTVIAIYLATIWCYYRALGPAGVAASEGVAASAASVAFGRLGGAFVAGLVVVSTLGSMSTSILAHSRIAFAAARDGLLFRGLDAIHPTFRTPSRAVVAHLVVCLLLLAVRQSMAVAFSALAFGRFVFMAMVAVSLLRLRRRPVEGADVFRLPFHPVLPALFLAGAVVLLVARVLLQPRDTMVDLAILVGALAFVPLARLWRRRPGPAVVGGSADA